MALSDPAGIVLAVNPAYTRLYGYTPEETVGKEFAIIFPEAERAEARRQYRLAFARAASEDVYESVVRHADGQVRLVESRVAFVEDAGRRVAMISAVRDVTEQKQAGLELADSRSFADHLLKLTPDFIVVHDRLAARDVRLNDRLEEILGYNRYAGEPATRADFFRLFHPDDLHLFLQLRDQVSLAADGEIVATELRMRHVDGSWRRMQMRQMILRRDSTGAPQQILVLVRELTGR
jgi:PAS domain S-box-containing protein